MGSLDILDEACDRLPHTRRAMFGGHGFFASNGGMFAAIVDGDRVALKFPDEASAGAFLAAGAQPWVYAGRTSMRHWFVVPEAFLDELPALAEWVRRAHALAKPSKPKGARGKAAGKGAKGSR